MIALSDDILLNLDAVVKRSQLSRRTWRRIIRAGKIGVLRIEGTIRIPKTELERFLTERFTPARVIAPGPVNVEAIIDRALPRRRGRPRVGGMT